MFFKKAIIDRFEGEMAVLITKDGQTLDWDRASLPKNTEVGDEIVLELKALGDAHVTQQELAQNVLEELFNGK